MAGGASVNANGNERDKADQLYMLISFWCEAIIYGGYLVLFVGTLCVMAGNRSKGHRISMVFFISMIIMFILTTIFTGINVHRFVRAYAENVPPALPIYYFRDFKSWDNLSYVVIVILLIWHADALVIYRCFVLWEYNWYVVTIPTLLLFLSIGINSVAIYCFIHPRQLAFSTVHSIFDMIYPVNLAQNCLTTGLIAFKIWRQYRISRAAGLIFSTGLHLLTIMRIIIESASIYTVQQLVLLVLYSLNHPAQLILHATMIPSIGIVFLLIAIRTHAARPNGMSQWRQTLLMIPSYPHDSDPSPGRRGSSMIATTMTSSTLPNHQAFHAGDMVSPEKDENLQNSSVATGSSCDQGANVV